MSHSGHDASKGPSSPQRSRHEITRSISELSSPIRLHRHHSHRANKEREQRDALSPVPSNTGVRASLEGGSPSGAVTPNLSPNPSRRTSILYAQTADNNNTHPKFPPSNKGHNVSAQDRQRAIAARESGLRTTMSQLENFHNTSTRRLDGAYESVLERLGTLQSTILALRELAGLSRDMNQTFTTEASELITETSSQLDAFGQFEDQQKRIESLQRRVDVGRDKIKGLSERVDRVKERIERWERADREWQERTRRRLRWVWMATSLLVFFIVLLVLSVQYTAPAEAGLGETAKQIVNDSLDRVKNVTTSGNRQDIISSGGSGGSGLGKDRLDKVGSVEGLTGPGQLSSTSSSTLVLPSSPSSSGDKDMLRAFDEL
ncbi:hypothetical protein V8F20_001953 [Naviculisporaceae sp. PSN 640]